MHAFIACFFLVGIAHTIPITTTIHNHIMNAGTIICASQMKNFLAAYLNSAIEKIPKIKEQ